MSSSAEESVRSSDGTEIAFVRLGHGEPLVLVHGSLASGEAWLPVATILANRFTCLVMDRRGHGRSGDSPSYTIEREYKDIEAVLATAGSQVSLLGHSYGAVCALGAATRTQVTHLVLYEPPLPVNGSITGGALLDYANAIQSGNFDGALAIGLSKFAGVTSEQIQALRRSPLWPKMVALAPTWTREVAAVDALGPSLARYRDLLAPTLLLSGTLSPKHPLQEASEALATRLKTVQLSRLELQGHNAHSLAPELVAERLAAFLLSG
jgi:pimeloyl-ACP methyl ester carboxylesterase